jgi:hypothetical protein
MLKTRTQVRRHIIKHGRVSKQSSNQSVLFVTIGAKTFYFDIDSFSKDAVQDVRKGLVDKICKDLGIEQ